MCSFLGVAEGVPDKCRIIKYQWQDDSPVSSSLEASFVNVWVPVLLRLRADEFGTH